MKPNQMTPDQFSLWLGEVLQPRVHTWSNQFPHYCVTCRISKGVEENEKCSDPIPLDDWNVAMKFFRAIGDEFPGEIKKVIREIFYNAVDDGNEAACALACFGEDALEANVSVWFNFYATERDYLQAAANCKLNKEKEK